MACGGGGGGGGASEASSSGSLKARFNPKGIYNALDDDRLLIYKLGDKNPILEIPDLASAGQALTVSFEFNQNYLLVVQRLGVVNFLSTLITEGQIQSAQQSGVLNFGQLNSVTTLLTHRLDATTESVPSLSSSDIQAEVDKYFNGVNSFAELAISPIRNSEVSKTDTFYQSFANRANAMTAYSSLLYLKKKESLDSGVPLTDSQVLGYQQLHRAIMTGTVADWTSAVRAVESTSTLPVLDNSLLSFLDGNSSSETDVAKKNLGIANKIFGSDESGFYVVDANDLHNVFYDPDEAEDSFLFEVTVETIPDSVISGTIEGPGRDDAEVILYRPSKDHDSVAKTGYVVQSVNTDSNGDFNFGSVPSDDEYTVLVKKPGYLYKAGTVLTKAGNVAVTIDSYSWDMDTLVLDSNGNISIADGAITSDKLASSLSVEDLTVTGTTTVGGMVFPEATSGTTGQAIIKDGSGNLSFSTIVDTILNVAAAVTITGDWVNTANPWANNEVAEDLTIDGGTIEDTPIGATTPSTGEFTSVIATVLTANGANVNGMLMPTADGTAGQAIVTDGSGTLTFSNMGDANIDDALTIDGGTVENTPIGATTPSTGGFTTLSTTGDLSVTGAANLSGILYPETDGSSSQVLFTNGNGQIGFMSISGTVFVGANVTNPETIGADWVNTANPWADNEVADSLTLTGGSIDGVAIGATTGSTGNFTTLSATSLTANGANLNGLLLPLADGTAGQVLVTDGAGNLMFVADDTGVAPSFGPWANSNIDTDLTIDGGQIDDTPVGATTPSTGAFTTLVTTGSTNLSGLLMPTVDGSIGQVLTTDGAGTLIFSNVSSGGGSGGANLNANETILGDWTNTTNPWADNEVADDLTVTGGTLNDSSVGATTPSTGAFTTLSANTSFSLNGMSFTLTDGAPNQVLSTDGSGNIGFMTVSISNDGQTYTNAWIQSGNFTGNVTDSAISTSTVAASTLSVNGMAYPVTDGVANQVLSTDGSGNITFMTVSISNDGQTYTQVEIESGNVTGNVIGSAVTASTLDSTTIGATTPSTGAFTTLSANTSFSLNGMVFPMTQGSANQVLAMKTDGSNELMFVNVNTSRDGQTYTNAYILSGNFTGNVIGSMISSSTLMDTTLGGNLSGGNFVSGNIEGTPIGVVDASSGNFTTLQASSANLSGLVYPAVDGSANQFLITAGNGHMSFASVNVLLGSLAGNYTIEGGSIDGTPIGATSASTGAFTSLSSNSITVSSDISATGNISGDGNLIVLGDTTLGDNHEEDSLTIMSTVGAGTTIGGNIWFQGNLISNSNSYSLGTESNPWKRIYAIDLVTTSDERLKDEIQPIKYGLSEVMKLRPVSYKWKNQSKDEERTLGFLAQEVETVIDEVVTDTDSEEETIGVRYANMVPVLIKAMQQQQDMIEKQAKLLEEQSKRLEALEYIPSK